MDKRCAVLICIFAMTPVMAQDAPNTKESETEPSVDLLEFLGDWESSNGTWMDPMQFMEMSENVGLMQDEEDQKHD